MTNESFAMRLTGNWNDKAKFIFSITASNQSRKFGIESQNFARRRGGNLDMGKLTRTHWSRSWRDLLRARSMSWCAQPLLKADSIFRTRTRSSLIGLTGLG